MSNIKDSIYSGMVEEPCPPMTLRIGVAGHRRIDEKQLSSIRQQLKNIYTDIYLLLQKIVNHEIAKNIYAPNQIIIRYISSLAEGADRLCIEPELITFKHELAAILPFAREEYEKDFSPEFSEVDSVNGTTADFHKCLSRIGFDQTGDNSNVSIIEIDGDRLSESEAYINCSKLLVENSDLLVAVYDGDLSKKIGTARTVKEAIERGIPVIQVSTQSPEKVTMHASCLFEHAGTELEYTKNNLEKELKRQLLFLDMIKKEELVLERFRRYRLEGSISYDDSSLPDFDSSGPIELTKDFPNLGSRAFNFFKKIMTRGTKVKQIVDEMKNSSAIGAGNQENSSICDSLSSHHIYSAFLRSDRIATYYANIHRSIFLSIYLFGAMALITAASALAFSKYHVTMFVLVIVELLLLCLIFCLYRMDHRRDYHNRWLEYRYLAEILRPSTYLNLLGKSLLSFAKFNTSTSLNDGFVGHHSTARCWIYIYLKSVIRWAGFSYCPLSDLYTGQVNSFINEAWLRSQIDYHINNAAKMKVIGERLKLFSTALFFATMATVLAKIVILIMEFSFHVHFEATLTSLVGLFTAVFPILATAAFAIRNHAEFDISAQRSLSTLAIFLAQYKSDNTKNEMIYQNLLQLANESINEAAEWLEIYEVKEAEPA